MCSVTQPGTSATALGERAQGRVRLVGDSVADALYDPGPGLSVDCAAEAKVLLRLLWR